MRLFSRELFYSSGYFFNTPKYISNLGHGNKWVSLAYGDGKFVALGEKGHISVSTDSGKTWSAAVKNTDLGENTWSTIVFGGDGLFFALSMTGYLSYSTDGTRWSYAQQIANLGNKNWYSFTYGNGKFVALSHQGYISTSQYGYTWSAATKNSNLYLADGSWRAIGFTGNVFAAISSLLYGGYQSQSENGTTWDAKKSVWGGEHYSDAVVATALGKIGKNPSTSKLYGLFTGGLLVYYDETSKSWKRSYNIGTTGYGSTWWSGLAYDNDNNKFIALDYYGYISNTEFQYY